MASAKRPGPGAEMNTAEGIHSHTPSRIFWVEDRSTGQPVLFRASAVQEKRLKERLFISTGRGNGIVSWRSPTRFSNAQSLLKRAPSRKTMDDRRRQLDGEWLNTSWRSPTGIGCRRANVVEARGVSCLSALRRNDVGGSASAQPVNPEKLYTSETCCKRRRREAAGRANVPRGTNQNG